MPEDLCKMQKVKTRSVSAENFTAEKGKGGMSTDGAAKECARDLGIGWKVSPFYTIHGGETQPPCGYPPLCGKPAGDARRIGAFFLRMSAEIGSKIGKNQTFSFSLQKILDFFRKTCYDSTVALSMGLFPHFEMALFQKKEVQNYGKM